MAKKKVVFDFHSNLVGSAYPFLDKIKMAFAEHIKAGITIEASNYSIRMWSCRSCQVIQGIIIPDHPELKALLDGSQEPFLLALDIDIQLLNL